MTPRTSRAVTRRLLEVYGAGGVLLQPKQVVRWRTAVEAGKLAVVRSVPGSLRQRLEVRP